MKVVDFENLEDLNNLNVNVFELNEHKTLTKFYLSKNMNKVLNDANQLAGLE